MAVEVNFDVPRNASYLRRWELTNDAGEAIDLTDHQIEARVSRVAGGPLIAPGRITARDDEAGAFDVEFHGSDYAGVSGTQQIVRISYQLIIANADGIRFHIARGHLVLIPGA